MAVDTSGTLGLCNVLEEVLYYWAEYIPYDYRGDDLRGHGGCRNKFNSKLSPKVRRLAMALEAEGRSVAATELRRAFGALAKQCSAMDEWCEDNPAPLEVGLHWPADAAAEAVGDPDWQIFRNCCEILRDILGSTSTAPCPEVGPLSPNNDIAHRAHRAHREKLFPKSVPTDSNLVDAIVLLDTERNDTNTDIEILRDFFNETVDDFPKARKMQTQIRKARIDGRTSLPTR